MLKRIIDKRLRALEAKNLEAISDEDENGDEILRKFHDDLAAGKPRPPRRPIDPNHPMAAIVAMFERE